jgi:hypothetical protein
MVVHHVWHRSTTYRFSFTQATSGPFIISACLASLTVIGHFLIRFFVRISLNLSWDGRPTLQCRSLAASAASLSLFTKTFLFLST